ncbi:MAG: DUF1345 domain-containing protein [Verrucomicrobia bacterium]|nr:DUF1345 domain-containing protein [Verrucomicrobiota bacterium]
MSNILFLPLILPLSECDARSYSMQPAGFQIDAHKRFFLALLVAGLVFAMLQGRMQIPAQALLSWNGFAFSSLALAWIQMIFSDARAAVRTAKLQDVGRTVLFLVVILGTVASLVAVIILLSTAKGLHRGALSEHIIVACLTVLTSWVFMHTIFALHYAHLYYRECDDDPESGNGTGLIFPEDDLPDYLDFAYFSFVIGMTFQVSDVQITASRIRRMALIHGLLSFGFNTVILALAINIASGLFGS